MTTTQQLVLPSLSAVMEFFFQKSLRGYAGNGQFTPVGGNIFTGVGLGPGIRPIQLYINDDAAS